MFQHHYFKTLVRIKIINCKFETDLCFFIRGMNQQLLGRTKDAVIRQAALPTSAGEEDRYTSIHIYIYIYIIYSISPVTLSNSMYLEHITSLSYPIEILVLIIIRYATIRHSPTATLITLVCQKTVLFYYYYRCTRKVGSFTKLH
jgi:hypothetical protein